MTIVSSPSLRLKLRIPVLLLVRSKRLGRITLWMRFQLHNRRIHLPRYL